MIRYDLKLVAYRGFDKPLKTTVAPKCQSQSQHENTTAKRKIQQQITNMKT